MLCCLSVLVLISLHILGFCFEVSFEWKVFVFAFFSLLLPYPYPSLSRCFVVVLTRLELPDKIEDALIKLDFS